MSKKRIAISGFLFTFAALIMTNADKMEEGYIKYGAYALAFSVYCITSWAVQQGIILGFKKK